MNDLLQALKLTQTEIKESLIDIGARDTNLARHFKQQGLKSITLLDKEDLIDGNNDDFKFIKQDITEPEFLLNDVYDLVVCRHTLPFTKEPLVNLSKILIAGKIIYVTFFGENDDRKKLSLLSQETIDSHLEKFPDYTVIYKNNLEYDGFLYNGDKIHWNVLGYLIKRKY